MIEVMGPFDTFKEAHRDRVKYLGERAPEWTTIVREVEAS
jgi:hypothetical protein